MGKGGVNGDVTFPAYIEDQHSLWLQGFTADAGSWSGRTPLIPNRTLAESMNHAFANNPWLTVNLIDPTSIFAISQTRFSEYDSRLQLLDDQGDWENRVLKAVAVADTAGTLKPLNVGLIHDTARQEASDEVNSALATKAFTGVSELTNWQTFISGIKTKLDEAGLLNQIDIDAIITKARSTATAELTEAQTLDSGVDEETYWLTLVDVALNKINECGFIKEIEMPVLVQQAAIYARNQVESIVSTVADLVDWGKLDDLVDAYEQGAQIQRAKVVRSFTGSMADIGAVHSSAFVIGLGQVYNQFAQDTNRFRAERVHELFRELLQTQTQSILGQINAFVQVKTVNKQSRDQILSFTISSILQMFAERVRFEQHLQQLHSLTHRDLMGHGSGIEIAEKGSRDGLLGQSTQLVERMLEARINYEQALMNMHSRLFAGSLETQLRAGVVEKASRDNLIGRGSEQMHMALLEKMKLDYQASVAQTEMNRIKYVGLQEYKTQKLEQEVRHYMWDFSVFENGARILGAPTGMSAGMPHGPSRAASAVGGAMQGAAMGAAVGSLIPGGTLVGAAIGGTIGGLGGLLQ